MRDPTRRIPRGVPTGGPAWRDFPVWIGRIVIGMMPFVAYRLASHAAAFVRWRTAGECPNCLANLTWRIGSEPPAWCPMCGHREPFPLEPPGSP